MKKISLLILFSVFSLISCVAEKKAATNLNIGVISDLHYLSQKLMDDGQAATSYSNTTGRNILAVPEILDQVINEYLKSDIEYLFIPGDLTKDGEKESHKELIQKLKPLQEKGIKIYVVPGNHDINIPNSKGFKGNGTYPTSSISAKEFEQLYDSFGYGEAISRDTASLSYVTQLDDNFWLIAIDGIKYEEYTTSSITSGRIKPKTEEWIIDIMNEAKQKGKTVIGMMHHGLVEHIIYQDAFFNQYLIDDWQRLADIFAEGGMKTIFTGHFHANDITKFTSTNKHSIYDIETGALCSYPFAYRFISLNEKGMDITTRNIKQTPSFPTLVDDSKKSLFEIAQNMAKEKIQSKGFSFSEALVKNLTELAGYIFLEHVKGDEQLDGNIKKSLESLKDEMALPIDTESTPIELDFYPSDNNIKIEFD